jgi:hypothetical protein
MDNSIRPGKRSALANCQFCTIEDIPKVRVKKKSFVRFRAMAIHTHYLKAYSLAIRDDLKPA